MSYHRKVNGKTQEVFVKILVFSDSHGLSAPMLDIIRREVPDEIFHLGDGFWDVDEVCHHAPNLTITRVPGNCDLVDTLAAAPTQVVERDGTSILLTHGHAYGVKHGLGGLLAEARRRQVSVVLFGHTHHPHCELEDGRIWMMNPGSVGSLSCPSYGVIILEQGSVLCYTG